MIGANRVGGLDRAAQRRGISRPRGQWPPDVDPDHARTGTACASACVITPRDETCGRAPWRCLRGLGRHWRRGMLRGVEVQSVAKPSPTGFEPAGRPVDHAHPDTARRVCLLAGTWLVLKVGTRPCLSSPATEGRAHQIGPVGSGNHGRRQGGGEDGAAVGSVFAGQCPGLISSSGDDPCDGTPLSARTVAVPNAAGADKASPTELFLFVRCEGHEGQVREVLLNELPVWLLPERRRPEAVGTGLLLPAGCVERLAVR